MVPDIITKLQNELNAGIQTEAQVVYLLAEIRKIIEQEETEVQYQFLKFHADWALHAKLQGTFAQRVLTCFDQAHIQFRTGIELHDLPLPLQREVEDISGMGKFKEELSHFLRTHDLPDLTSGNPDIWTRFLYLYAKVIKDCPLVILSSNASSSITNVTVSAAVANQLVEDHTYYKIMWKITDRNGMSGEFFVINSFSN